MMLNLEPDLGHVLQALTNFRPTGNEPVVSSFVVDSREAVLGSMFIAFRGENTDGHDFVADAFQRGAIAALIDQPVMEGEWATIETLSGKEVTISRLPVCILVEDALRALQQIARDWREHFNTRIIAITGSIGKTSTKELSATVLSQRFQTLKSEGNQNNEIGLPLTLLNLRPHHERAVVEMGMYAQGEIDLLCTLAKPVVGVITMIAPVHLARLGSIEAIVAAKRELIAALPDNGVAILNMDDPRVMEMAPFTRAQVFTYGLSKEADLWANDIESMGLDGVRFTLHHRRESLSIRVPLLGRHSVHTALRAAAVGLIEGLRWDEIIGGLSAMSPQLRLMVIPGPRDSLIIDDTYNSSPDSALAALNLLADLDGRRIAVLGDMLELGNAELEGHRVVGRRTADVADVLITVGPRARTIGLEALEIGMAGNRVEMVEEAPDAIPLLEKLINHGDTILVKGSLGMRMDRIVTALGRHD